MLCVDCKHNEAIEVDDGYYLHYCHHEVALVKRDFVVGEETFRLCREMRDNLMPCGPVGRLFEKKITLFGRIKQLFS